MDTTTAAAGGQYLNMERSIVAITLIFLANSVKIGKGTKTLNYNHILVLTFETI